MPTLIHFPLDPYSRRVRLALAEYGRPAELIEEQPWQPSPDLYALDPTGGLPVFIDDNRAVICGAAAIGEYLEETLATWPSLLPGSAAQRAEARRLVGWFEGRFHSEVSGPVLSEKAMRRFLPRERGGGAPDMGRVRAAIASQREHFDYLGELADARTWLAGSQLTLADLAAAAHISVLDFLGEVPWPDYPSVKTWYQRMKSRPSFRA
ncbi:MAG: glutathione S-transferase family protein, partial [Alphaproteobacteria bacterium]|nr:glutathione S-transferase family protein [Alphaproteobacteria bacterium]